MRNPTLSWIPERTRPKFSRKVKPSSCFFYKPNTESILYKRRVKKRQARLLVAAEEAFTHIRRKIENHGIWIVTML